MAFSAAPLCVFVSIIIIITIITILTDLEALPHMSTNDDEFNGYYIPKGTIVFGNSWSVWSITGPHLYLDLDRLCLGPYYMTPKFSKTPWSSSLNDTWRMESSIQMWWTGTLWHLVTDAGEYNPNIFSDITSHWTSLLQNLSWKTLEWQLIILDCILYSRSLWHQTSGWRPGECHQAQSRVY